MKNFWKDLEELHARIEQALETRDGWKQLTTLLEERQSLMSLMVDLIRRGHLSRATPIQVQQLEDWQQRLIRRSEEVLQIFKQNSDAAEAYERQNADIVPSKI